eukprot:scaffold2326_cov41-Phaeocystis_antarctica.AAC.3
MRPYGKRSVGTRRAASMQDTLSEGTARAAQLAPCHQRRGCRVSPTTSPSFNGCWAPLACTPE